MKPLLLLTTMIFFTACLSKKQPLAEPNLTENQTNLKTNSSLNYDFSGELKISDIKVPIDHSRDTIKVQLRPINYVVPVWDYLEERQLYHNLGNNRGEGCIAKISTFKRFKHETPYIQNITKNQIEIMLNDKGLNVDQDYTWEIFDNTIDISINNPHLKEAHLTIKNKTIKDLYYTKLDIRSCSKTKILKHTKTTEDYKIDIPEHYTFDYNIY